VPSRRPLCNMNTLRPPASHISVYGPPACYLDTFTLNPRPHTHHRYPTAHSSTQDAMKFIGVSTFVAAGFALLMNTASAQPCPHLSVHIKAPRVVRSNNKLRTIMVTVKNSGNTAANNIGLDVSGTLM
jgi:hypothetical protein